jgi:hypothetical protein
MPTYDYHCQTNGRTVEVKHRMSEEVTNWGQLCALAGISLDGTPAETPVAKKLTATAIAGSSNLGGDTGPPISGGCGSGFCGHSH